MRNEQQGVVAFDMVTAQPVDDAMAQRVAADLKQKFGSEVELHTFVNPALLGGVLFRTKDKVYDASIARKLQLVREDAFGKRLRACGRTPGSFPANDENQHHDARSSIILDEGRCTMKFNADEIASVIQKEIEQFDDRVDVHDVGTVLEVGDGIARVYGLSNVMVSEMVEFPGGVIGLAFNLEENSVGVIILGDFLKISEGDEVRGLGKLLSVPVGDAVLGRVVDPLGNPLDGQGPINTDARPRLVEILAPGVSQRQPVHQPLQTGIKAIDAMTPIGRGQRELIIGDRKTGKDGHRHRRHPQPEGFGREVLLRRHWAKGLVGGRCDRSACENTARWTTRP